MKTDDRITIHVDRDTYKRLQAIKSAGVPMTIAEIIAELVDQFGDQYKEAVCQR